MNQIIPETQEDQINIEIKRPFVPKFFRELNHHQDDMNRKMRHKGKQPSLLDHLLTEKSEKMTLGKEGKPLVKPIEIIRNGNRIIATWKNDQIHGNAEIYYHNGVVFKGLYQNGIKVQGHFKFNNGFEYTGDCLNNKFNGQGSLLFPSGKIITGEWQDYKIIGDCKVQYPKGEVYYGQIQHFKKHGKGYLFFIDGSKYVGEFKEGLITGFGTYYVKDKEIASGIWTNGKLHGCRELNECEDNQCQKELQNKQGHFQIKEKQQSVKQKEMTEKSISSRDEISESFTEVS